MKNKAWNLSQGDGRQYAASSFTIEQGQYAKINAYGLCGDDKIIIIEIDDAPNCSEMDSMGVIFKRLTSANKTGVIGSAGRYILARQVGSDQCDVLALNAFATVRMYTLKQGVHPVKDSGFE